MILLFKILFLLISFEVSSLASDTWCLENRSEPPCNGAPGRCTLNIDKSYGGFVAYTAHVEQYNVYGQSLNLPFIDVDAQVCEKASVLHSAEVLDNAIVSGEAIVRGYAKVTGNANVSGAATIFGEAIISENARVEEDASVSGSARISGCAIVRGATKVLGHASISGNARVLGNTRIDKQAIVRDFAKVNKRAHITGRSLVSGEARVRDDSVVTDDAWVTGKSKVAGESLIKGHAIVHENALVSDSTVQGKARIFGQASIVKSFVLNDAWVSGEARLNEKKAEKNWVTHLSESEDLTAPATYMRKPLGALKPFLDEWEPTYIQRATELCTRDIVVRPNFCSKIDLVTGNPIVYFMNSYIAHIFQTDERYLYSYKLRQCLMETTISVLKTKAARPNFFQTVTPDQFKADRALISRLLTLTSAPLPQDRQLAEIQKRMNGLSPHLKEVQKIYSPYDGSVSSEKLTREILDVMWNAPNETDIRKVDLLEKFLFDPLTQKKVNKFIWSEKDRKFRNMTLSDEQRNTRGRSHFDKKNQNNLFENIRGLAQSISYLSSLPEGAVEFSKSIINEQFNMYRVATRIGQRESPTSSISLNRARNLNKIAALRTWLLTENILPSLDLEKGIFPNPRFNSIRSNANLILNPLYELEESAVNSSKQKLKSGDVAIFSLDRRLQFSNRPINSNENLQRILFTGDTETSGLIINEETKNSTVLRLLKPSTEDDSASDRRSATLNKAEDLKTLASMKIYRFNTAALVTASAKSFLTQEANRQKKPIEMFIREKTDQYGKLFFQRITDDYNPHSMDKHQKKIPPKYLIQNTVTHQNATLFRGLRRSPGDRDIRQAVQELRNLSINPSFPPDQLTTTEKLAQPKGKLKAELCSEFTAIESVRFLMFLEERFKEEFSPIYPDLVGLIIFDIPFPQNIQFYNLDPWQLDQLFKKLHESGKAELIEPLQLESTENKLPPASS